MKKGCPILRFAYLIALALESKDSVVRPDVKDARCMGTYCALYDEKRNKCGLVKEV